MSSSTFKDELEQIVYSVIRPLAGTRCATLDKHDYPDLKDGERCPVCEVYEKADQALTSIINLVDKERAKDWDKYLQNMKDIFAENFHYRIMCGEIKDPEGKIDVHKAFIDYQELEPERKKFVDYLEEQRAIIRR